RDPALRFLGRCPFGRRLPAVRRAVLGASAGGDRRPDDPFRDRDDTAAAGRDGASRRHCGRRRLAHPPRRGLDGRRGGARGAGESRTRGTARPVGTGGVCCVRRPPQGRRPSGARLQPWPRRPTADRTGRLDAAHRARPQLRSKRMKAAVVLMAYGSPERLADVPAYYADIRGGRPIAPENLADLVERYRRLGIEDSSPLNAITERTRAALERELGLPVFTGMKHWPPRIADSATAALAAGAGTIVGLVLAPHYSALSIKGYRDQLEAALEGRAELRFVDSWHDEEGFVRVLADKIRGTHAHVVFTAHSLPERVLAMGDPYKDELLHTAELVAAAAGVTDWTFSFQSESPTGEPWLGPDILDHLRDLYARGVRRILVCPVGFVSDHLEIRWDLDVEAVELAHELGLELARIEMPNDEPAFVATLAAIVRRTLGVPS